MPLAGKDGEYQVKWLDPATDFYSKVEFKYPMSFVPFQDFEFKDDPAGGALVIESLCEALGPGERRQDDLLIYRTADDFAADEDWPLNWLMITLATRSVLGHVRDDLERKANAEYEGTRWSTIASSDETVLMDIEVSANGWLERGAGMSPLESVDAEAKSAFRAWCAEVVQSARDRVHVGSTWKWPGSTATRISCGWKRNVSRWANLPYSRSDMAAVGSVPEG
jgi:hypothetical protein